MSTIATKKRKAFEIKKKAGLLIGWTSLNNKCSMIWLVIDIKKKWVINELNALSPSLIFLEVYVCMDWIHTVSFTIY